VAMFSEPLPAGEETGTRQLPELPPWSGPPALETGAVLAIEETVARSANVAVRLPMVRAFRSGCMFDVEVVSRQGELSEEDWIEDLTDEEDRIFVEAIFDA
jgi:hypothetical protein